MTQATKTIRESVVESIPDEATERLNYEVAAVCYGSLIVDSDGELRWSGKLNSDECGESEYFGRQRSYWTLATYGNPGVDSGHADHDVYVTRAVTQSEQDEIDASVDEWGDENEITVDGVLCRKSLGWETGYADGEWYVVTDEMVASYRDAYPDEDLDEVMAAAIEEFDRIPVGFFDDESPSTEWLAMTE